MKVLTKRADEQYREENAAVFRGALQGDKWFSFGVKKQMANHETILKKGFIGVEVWVEP